VKQNVIANTFFTVMDVTTTILLYVVFPIVPLYVFIVLLVLVLTSSIFKRYGLVSAIIVTYVIFIFITALNRASLLIMPFLLLTYLITEAGIINDIAVISWTLLFTPLYWLSIPLAITPTIKGYGIRSSVVFSLLSLLYIIAAAFIGIKWIPITAISTSNLNLIQGLQELLFGNVSITLGMGYDEVINVLLYVIFAIIIVAPPLIGRYLTRIVTQLALGQDIVQVIMNLAPLLLTVALLYIPGIIINSVNYEVTPLIMLGSVIMGSLGYLTDKLPSIMRLWIVSLTTNRKKMPIAIPIIDPLVITEYGYWAKKLPKEDQDIVSNIVNTVSKTGFVVLKARWSQDKIDITSKVLFGITRAKGFIIKGDIDYIPEDVDWFVRTHEKSLLIIIPTGSINKRVVSKLIDYTRRVKANVVIVNTGNDAIINNLRRYGIETLDYEPEVVENVEQQTKQIEEINVSNNNNISNATTNAEATKVISEKPEQKINVEPPPIGNNVETKRVEEEVNSLEISKNTAVTKPINREIKPSTEQPQTLPRKVQEATGKKKSRDDKGKRTTGNVVVMLDPVDLINMSIKSKLIDYVDSSVRLRDMLANLGLKYVSSILIVGPPRSGKTALINYVSKHLGVQIIDYKDPSISITDNAIIHVPNLEEAINENVDHVRKLINIAKAKHLVVIFESSNPWSLDQEFIKNIVDAVIPILPPTDDYIDEVIQNKLNINNKDAEIIKSIIKSCPAVEAIEKIGRYLSSKEGDIICDDMFKKYQDYSRSLSA